eukprot:2469156-Pyramimonas_sp.AAC.1
MYTSASQLERASERVRAYSARGESVLRSERYSLPRRRRLPRRRARARALGRQSRTPPARAPRRR